MPETVKKTCDDMPAQPRNLAEVEKTKGDYYYDDAHGYEVYVPENDDDEASDRPDTRISS